MNRVAASNHMSLVVWLVFGVFCVPLGVGFDLLSIHRRRARWIVVASFVINVIVATGSLAFGLKMRAGNSSGGITGVGIGALVFVIAVFGMRRQLKMPRPDVPVIAQPAGGPVDLENPYHPPRS